MSGQFFTRLGHQPTSHTQRNGGCLCEGGPSLACVAFILTFITLFALGFLLGYLTAIKLSLFGLHFVSCFPL
jgi:hypothetical protein